MIGTSPNERQKHLFLPNLTDFINLQHQRVLVGEEDWLAPIWDWVGSVLGNRRDSGETDSVDGRVEDAGNKFTI